MIHGILPGMWKEAKDPLSGQSYYYNTTTRENQWTHPSTGVCQQLPQHWQSIVDPSSGKTYYFNDVTRQVTWECPTPTLEDNLCDVVCNQEGTENAVQRQVNILQGQIFSEPTYDRIFKSKQVKKKDRVGLYGKTYLREHFGLNWHAHKENIRIVNSWFDPSIEQARTFLHSSLKNNPHLVVEVKEYIEQKLAIKPALLHPYLFREDQTTTGMTWGVMEIYERFKQLKADYIKKLRKEGTVVLVQGSLGNAIHEDAEEDLQHQAMQTVDTEGTLHDHGCAQHQSHRHIQEIAEVQQSYVEHHYGLDGGRTEGDEEFEAQQQRNDVVQEDVPCTDEPLQCLGLHTEHRDNELLASHEYEIVVDHMEQEHDTMGIAEVSGLQVLRDVQKDSSSTHILVSQGLESEHVDGGQRKRRNKRQSTRCEGNNEPGTMRPRRARGRCEGMVLAGTDANNANTSEEQEAIDMSKLSEISKKVIGKHVMGCGVLTDVMKGIFDFASQLPGYNKVDFSKMNLKERKMLQLDFVVKWALRSRVTLREVDLVGTGEIKVDSSMVVDR